MKILIYGSKGWIGSQFLNYLNNIQELPFPNKKKQDKINNLEIIEGKSRVNNFIELKKELEYNKPDNVISFIGRTHGKIGEKEYTTIDYLEQEGKVYDNIRDNLYSPISLALICKELNIHYTYLGTGCIFSYRNEEEFGKEINGFTEESLPNFFGSSYSIVKGFTDMLMHQLESNVLNLKICSIPNSMTVLPDFYPIILDMMLKKETGTINLTNPGLISHNEILDMYKELVDSNFKYQNFTIEEQDKILDSKRSNNYLETKKIEWLYPQIKSIKESVRDILTNYKLD